MHDAERRQLTRAVALLMAVSVVRWVSSGRGDPSAGYEAGATALEEHIVATDSAVDEEERRGLPLAEGERLDPNHASEVELDRLPGVGPATASAMVAARDTAPFEAPGDLLRVRGIGPATLERIRPWIEVRRASVSPRRPAFTSAIRGRAAPENGSAPPPPVDVNRADAARLETLPGIGPALAARIIEARRRAPFRSVQDLQRVRGIGAATVARLQGLATVGGRR